MGDSRRDMEGGDRDIRWLSPLCTPVRLWAYWYGIPCGDEKLANAITNGLWKGMGIPDRDPYLKALQQHRSLCRHEGETRQFLHWFNDNEPERLLPNPQLTKHQQDQVKSLLEKYGLKLAGAAPTPHNQTVIDPHNASTEVHIGSEIYADDKRNTDSSDTDWEASEFGDDLYNVP